MEPRSEFWTHVAGAVAGTALAEAVTVPLCTTKTWMQGKGSTTFKHAATSIWKAGSWRGFYNAAAPAVASQVFSTSCKYTIYQTLQDGYNTEKHLSHSLAFGFASSALTSVVTHPMDVLKNHMQVLRSGGSVVSEMRKHGGSMAYAGYRWSMAKSAVASALFFPLHDTIKKHVFHPDAVGDASTWLSAACTAVVATTFIHPLDFLKTRSTLQLPLVDLLLHPPPSSPAGHWHHKVHWLNALRRQSYASLPTNLMRIVPHFTIVMLVSEQVEQWLRASR